MELKGHMWADEKQKKADRQKRKEAFCLVEEKKKCCKKGNVFQSEEVAKPVPVTEGL